MAYLNKVMLIGNIGREIEFKAFATGEYASFSLATSRKYKGNDGQLKEQTDWHTIVVYGKSVATLRNLHVGKGSRLFVEGELRNRSWNDKQTGAKRYATEVLMQTFQLLDSRQQGSAAPQQQQQGNFEGNDYGNAAEDDIPF